MQQVPAGLSQDDLHQWLHGCYFYMDTRRGRELCTLQAGREGQPHAAVSLVTDEIIQIDNTSSIHCFWPPTGAVNLPHRQFSIFVERLPRKQWRRSFSPQCYAFRRVGVGAQGFDSNTERASIASIECVVSPEFHSFAQAKRMFVNGWSSVAVTPQITLVNGDIMKVYWCRELVGKILRDGALYVHDDSMRRYVAPHLTE